jgi:NTP pyrophosphatase (non-canonical NTP hydrolase)
MRYEAKGQLDEAQEVYDAILQEDDTNMVMRNTQKFAHCIVYVLILCISACVQTTNCSAKGKKQGASND